MRRNFNRVMQGNTQIQGIALIILAVAIVGAVFIIPMDTAWSKYGESAITVHVMEYESGGSATSNQAAGALIDIKPTVEGGNVFDVFGSAPPSEADVYGLMTFYCDVGIYEVSATYDGRKTSGFVQTNLDEITRVYIFVYDNLFSCTPSENLVTESYDTYTVPQSTEPITVVVDTVPTGLYTVVYFTQRGGYINKDTPIQFTLEEQTFIQIQWADSVTGKVTPENWSGLVTSDLRVTGYYLTPEELEYRSSLSVSGDEDEGEEPPAGEDGGEEEEEEQPVEDTTTVDTEPLIIEEQDAQPTDFSLSAKEQADLDMSRKVTRAKTDPSYRVVLLLGALTFVIGAFFLVFPNLVGLTTR